MGTPSAVNTGHGMQGQSQSPARAGTVMDNDPALEGNRYGTNDMMPNGHPNTVDHLPPHGDLADIMAPCNPYAMNGLIATGDPQGLNGMIVHENSNNMNDFLPQDWVNDIYLFEGAPPIDDGFGAFEYPIGMP